MFHRPISHWDGQEGELADLAFGVMAIHWSRDKWQDLFNYITCAAYSQGQESKLWHYTYQMAETKERKPFHQLEITIQDRPTDWFHNLKLLQIRKALGPDYHLQVQCRGGRLPIGKLIIKIDGICFIIDNAKMKQYKLPTLKCKGAVRYYPPNLGTLRACLRHPSIGTSIL